MLIPVIVTIVVNGSIVTGSLPARIIGGRVVAPLTPVIVRLATRVSYDVVHATVTIERTTTRVVVPVAFVDDDQPFLSLSRVVRLLGGSASFDARTKTLAIAIGTADAIATPGPAGQSAAVPTPNAAELPLVLPSPPLGLPSAPRALDTAAPRPRRTAIPAIPSQPDLPDPKPPRNFFISRRR